MSLSSSSSRLDAQRLHDVLSLRLGDELLEDGLELLVAGQLAEVVPRVPPDVLAAVRQLLAPLPDHDLLRVGKCLSIKRIHFLLL